MEIKFGGVLERSAAGLKQIKVFPGVWLGATRMVLGIGPAPQCKPNEKSRAWTSVSNPSLPLSMGALTEASDN